MTPPDLTSLFDVLFILVFVALVHAAMSQRAAEDAAARATQPPPPPVPVPDAGVPVVAAAVEPERAALREEALARLTDELAGREAVVVRIASRPATLVAIEPGDRRIALATPLLVPVDDVDVGVAYAADRDPARRLCRLLLAPLGVPDLSRHLVVIAPALPLGDLEVALYQGLQADVRHCLVEQRGIAVIVDPGALTPPR